MRIMQTPSPPPDGDQSVETSAPQNRLQCTFCERTFSRTEHLRRHTLTHTKTRPFSCSICDKEFFRRDALQRHLITHQHAEPSLLQKGVRACLPCAAAKARCSGVIPCSRCQRRSMTCQPGPRGSQTFELPPPSPSTSAAQQLIQSSPVLRRPSGDNVWTTPVSHTGSTHPYPHSTEPHHDPASAPRPFPETSTPSVERASYILQELKFTQTSVQQQPLMHSRAQMQTSPAPPMNPSLSFSPARALTATQSSGLDQGAMMMSPSRRETTMQQSDDLFDVDAWNANLPFTINWLSDATFDLDNPLQPLSLSDSVYYNDFPHMFGSFMPHQAIGMPHTPMGSTPQNGFVVQDVPQDDARTHVTVSSDNASESLQSDEMKARSGQFYIDSDLSRLPRVKRRKYNARPVDQKQLSSYTQFSLELPIDFSADTESPYEIQTETYDKFVQMFQEWCVTPPALFDAFSSTIFPSPKIFDQMISLYFQTFHPTLPMLHSPTFLVTNPHWLLVLAIAAMGSHFLEAQGLETFAASMHEMLRRLLFVAGEGRLWLPIDTTTCVQIKLLHTIGAVYSGNEHLRRTAHRYDRELADFCQQNWSTYNSPMAVSDDQRTHEAEWLAWRDREIRHRTVYCIWLLDCMWGFHINRRPQLSLEDAQISLPCHEKLWAARNVLEWQRLKSSFSTPSSLLSSLQKIYVEKVLAADLGEFSRILLIHGLFQRSWEVETYYRQNLSRWEPTARKGSVLEPHLQSPIWLPSISTYAKWRNSACDCLDILHWSANATIGMASGMEHTTVMHLHLARVILLTPYDAIFKLARFSVDGPSSCRQSDILEYEQTIRKWATQDQYKARLAMIHAGVLFWHIRRFSANAFYEPISVAMATLALWAFARFHNKPLANPERALNSTETPKTSAAAPTKPSGDNGISKPNTDAESDSDEPIGCDIILLDRPTDDELVQNFVRRGHTMVANLAGVGNLYGDRSPELVLQEGRKILYGLSAWGIRHKLLETLDGLLDASKHKRR